MQRATISSGYQEQQHNEVGASFQLAAVRLITSLGLYRSHEHFFTTESRVRLRRTLDSVVKLPVNRICGLIAMNR